MSAPIVWIVVPALIAFLLYALRRWERTIHFAGLAVCLILALLAWLLPINEPIALGIPNMPSLRLTDTLQIYGRRLVIGNEEKPILILIYLGISLWLGGAFIARVQRLFVPLSLGIAATLTAALVIEPILYAALLIAAAALLCVGILSPPGHTTQGGVLRFLAFQMMGMCFILLADWMLKLLLINPNDASPLAPATLLFGMGFAVAGGILPFHTWIPMLAEDSHPYAATFIFFVIPVSIALVGLKYLQSFASLSIYPTIQIVLQYGGMIMVLVGGIWAAFERHLARILGFAMMVQLGMGLLAISLGTQAMQGSPLRSLFFAQLIPQGIALVIWAQALSCLRSVLSPPKNSAEGQRANPDMRFRAMQGMARQAPVAALSLILANFSLAGMPMLASFPGQIALWAALSLRSLPITLLSLVGSASLFAAGLRSMAVLVMFAPGSSNTQEEGKVPGWRISENRAQAVLLVAGILMLFTIGLTPQWLLPLIAGLPAFTIQAP